MAKSPRSSKAIAVGKALAAASIKRRTRAIRKRQRVLAKAKLEAAPATARALAAAPSTHASRGVLIAEGDSWFDYPFHDVLSELEDSYGYDVESVSTAATRLRI